MSPADEGRSLLGAASVEPLGNGRFSAQLSPAFTAVGHPHGGYLQCVMASAALAGASEEGASHLHVTAMTTSFVNAPVVGPAEVRVEVRRVGRGVSYVYAALYQHDVLAIESLATLGTLRADSAVRYQQAELPDVVPLEQSRAATWNDEVNILQSVDLRLDPAVTGWFDGQLSSHGEVRGWMRLVDGATGWDPWSLLFASDALPPATLPLGSSGWVPALQLSSYVRRVPTSEWLRARQWAILIADGLVEERCELFDDAGQLVASSTQLAMVRLPVDR